MLITLHRGLPQVPVQGMCRCMQNQTPDSLQGVVDGLRDKPLRCQAHHPYAVVQEQGQGRSERLGKGAPNIPNFPTYSFGSLQS